MRNTIATLTLALALCSGRSWADETVSLEAALAQSNESLVYLKLAMMASLDSVQALLPLAGDEKSEQRKQLAAQCEELHKRCESGHVDSELVAGVNQVGEQLKALELKAAANKEETQKAVRKAYWLSGLVMAMDATAGVALAKNIEQLQHSIEGAKDKKGGLGGLKNMAKSGKQVKEANDVLQTLVAYSKGLPVHKENMGFVRSTCKKFAEDLKFKLPNEIDATQVSDITGATKVFEQDLLD